MKLTKKNLIYIIIGVVFIGSLIAFFIQNKDKGPLKKSTATVTTIKEKKEEKILPHRDNEEDQQPEVITESKKVAESFVQSYVTLLPKHFESFLENVEPITNEGLYHKLMYANPSETNYSRKILKLQATPMDDIIDHRKTWQIIAFVRETKDSGSYLDKQLYFQTYVSLKKGKWVLSGLEVND
ncbi:hypothetical protein CN514_07645 [Bacillus sp. AFS001701]|uniref:hypothetical protein n=1 Tax=Bacillus sp. AFS001701 TaxID=2033480 RepID=UPI000BF91914|nr:hypothetical protein [Bacillus sp. AFS001701]PET71262.1 hypothetical protein CN514_07645 [Bacillus sp. AFS001701]